jgi:hypothetical protein
MTPATIGPTWKRDGGRFVTPEKSLGYRLAAEWAPKYIRQPDGPNAGEPWRFTKEQARFLAWWYALDDVGRFVYRSGVYRRMKGAGKNPFADAIAIIEFIGPCRFAGWDGDGQPIGAPHYASWVQMAAVSRDQTRNSMSLLPAMISREAIQEFEIDIGKEIIYAHRGRCRLEAVTSSPRSLEGGRATFIVLDETHHWLRSNEGHAMADVIARNAAKSRDGSSRMLAITNAHAPGEDSVAEHDYEAWKKIEAGISDSSDFLYDSLEAPEETPLDDDEQLREAIEAARGDAHWLDADRLIAEIRDPRTSAATARRFYLNHIVAEEDKPFDRHLWEDLVRPGYRVPEKAEITLGFDGSLSRDHTVLIGTEIATGYQWVVGYWIPHDTDGQINMAEVDQTMDFAFDRWKVWRLNADPAKWAIYMARWADKYGADRVVAWSSTLYRKIANMLVSYRDAMQAREVSHDGDRRFAAAIANAHKHMMQFTNDQNERMYILQKERPDSPLKIDAAMAGAFSWQARIEAIAAGVLSQKEIVWASV